MLRSLIGQFSGDLLVEITQAELRIFSFTSEARYVDEPLIAVEQAGDKSTVRAIGRASRNCVGPGIKVFNPFEHHRSMISSYTYAEKVLQFAFKSMQANAFQAAPRVIIHQLEKNEGGLTDIEARVLRELAFGSGAREVVVYQGDRINPRQDTFEGIKSTVNAI